MHCPRCDAEYRPGFERCADCGVGLVHDPREPEPEPDPRESEPEASGSSRWTQLCTVSTETEATLIQGYLESSGIPCSIESLVFRAEPVNFGPLARVRLHVLDKHVEEARKLLRDSDEAPEGVTPPARG